MDINLDYYKIFYYVGMYGGISAAAEELSISQPAVSQAIKQLEKALGTILFIRTSKGVHFTSEGEVLFSYIRRGYESILLGEQKLMEMLNLQHGEVRIGASDMTLQFYLLPFLEIFHEKFPKIKVTVSNAPTPETMKMMQEGKIDFGIVSSPIANPNGLCVYKVREIEDIFVGGSKFFPMREQTYSYKKLEELPIICLEENTSTRSYVNSFLRQNDVVLSPEFELATSDIMVQFALRNLGVASIVKNFAEKYIETGELFQLKFGKEIPKRHICVVTDENYPLSTAGSNLLKMILSTSNERSNSI